MTEFTPNQQRENLEALAAYLAVGETRMQFDMTAFCINNGCGEPEYGPYKSNCGTVGCALGHGPDGAGINGLVGEIWIEYARRVFGIFSDFLFGPEWNPVEPSPLEAANRISYYLDYGEPKGWATLLNKPPQNRPWQGYFHRSGRQTWRDIFDSATSLTDETVKGEVTDAF